VRVGHQVSVTVQRRLDSGGHGRNMLGLGANVEANAFIA
jgi:hypothetical protein